MLINISIRKNNVLCIFIYKSISRGIKYVNTKFQLIFLKKCLIHAENSSRIYFATTKSKTYFLGFKILNR